MTAFDPQAAAAALLAARRAAARLPGALGARNPADAYATHAALARLLGGAVPGWKAGNLTSAQRAASGIPTAICAPLLGPWFAASPARFVRAAFVDPPALECEFAFELGADIPPRAAPYTRADIEARVAALRPAIEIVDKRVAGATPLDAFADCMASGGFVYGAPIADWRRLDLATASVALALDGRASAQGTGAAIVGDPLLALVELANAPPPWTGLRAGQIVTTGSCTGMTPVVDPALAVADFGPLGKVEIRFA